MNLRPIINTVSVLMLLCMAGSCRKYLDAKSDSSLAIPSTLKDLQAIIDNNQNLNCTDKFLNNNADEYYITYVDWLNEEYQEKKDSYVWDPRTNETSPFNGWERPYISVFYANLVLDNLSKIPVAQQETEWNDIKGAGFFFRAFHFFQIAQIYAPQYDPATAATDLGIPLRLTSDFNEPSTRSTVQQTYDQIIHDLKEALPLLKPGMAFKSRPSRPAAHAMLARVYLQMGNYEEAMLHASTCLELYHTLLDYNDQPDVLNPFKRFNEEVIFYAEDEESMTAQDYKAIVDTVLYDSYVTDDLRKLLFFEDINGDGTFRFEGSYNGTAYDGVFDNGLFTGLATDEVYLIRAECLARMNKVSEAMADLNTLLVKRWKPGSFVEFTAANAEEALRIILQERQKELIYRGRRWSDLRRLNKEQRFATTLKRVLNGQIYNLPPNDLRYTFLIPADIIRLTGIQQNPR